MGIEWKKAFIVGGAVIALFIGSGFATGQELLQYFTAYGLQGFLVLIVFAIAFLYYNLCFAKVGAEQQFEIGNDVYKYYCGKYLGAFFDYYSTAFCYMSFFVMVGGASSTLYEGFGLPEWAGGIILTIIVVGIVCLGLNRLVEIIGVIGPVKIAFFVAVGLIVLVMDWGNIQQGLDVIANKSFTSAAEGESIVQAGDNCVISGLSYAGFVLFWFASFIVLLSKKDGKRNVDAGIVIGTVVICAAIVIIYLAQVANINTAETNIAEGTTYLWKADVPNLVLANKIWPPLSIVYAVVVFLGICATAVPLLYNPVSRFSQEGTAKFRLLAIGLGVAGLVIGLFVPYRTLVNVVYVLNGYIGAVLLLFLLYRSFKNVWDKRKGKQISNSDNA